jgi:hypothetical protein
LAELTRDSTEERPRSSSAVLSVLVGLVAVATLPAAIVVAERWERLTLLESSWAIIPAYVLGFAAVLFGRRARRTIDRTLGRVKGHKLAFVGRSLGYLTLYLAVTASIAVATYYVLRQIA